MFLGHHSTLLNSANRITLPSDWRSLVSGGLYITQGFDQNLLILTSDTFKEIYSQIVSLNIADPLARLLARMFLSTAVYINLDENEAIPVDQNLKDYAKLQEKVVIVGQGNYLEVWAPDQWDNQRTQIQDAIANSHRFAAFTITTN